MNWVVTGHPYDDYYSSNSWAQGHTPAVLSTKSVLMKRLRLEVKRPQDLQASPVAFVHDLNLH